MPGYVHATDIADVEIMSLITLLLHNNCNQVGRICLYVGDRVSKIVPPNVTKFSVMLHVAAFFSSALCTSGFVGDVLFSHNGQTYR